MSDPTYKTYFNIIILNHDIYINLKHILRHNSNHQKTIIINFNIDQYNPQILHTTSIYKLEN